MQAEERAFATLVALRPDTNDRIHKLFESVHGKPDGQEALLDRDYELKRRKEQGFGFKMFMRTFVQTASHHFQLGIGSNSLSFLVINTDAFQRYLKDSQHEDSVDKLFAHWEGLVTGVDTMMKNALHCDSYQFMPETASLVPVFQLLLSYPETIEKHAQLLQYFVLKLLLSELTQQDLLKKANGIAKSKSLGDCEHIIHSNEREPTDAVLKTKLEDARSLQSRYALLLYWLERKQGAKDFLYEQVVDERPVSRLRPGEEVVITADCNPEKQHIVPYSWLKQAFDIEARGRVSRHEVNNVGNLTYISRALNHFDGGLGEQWLDFSKEPPENLKNHFINETALEHYSTLSTMQKGGELNDAQKREARKLFGSFVAARRECIAEGFTDWLDDLYASTELRETVDGRMEPTARLFNPTVEDKIRKLHYDNRIEDELTKLAGQKKGIRLNPRNDDDSLRWMNVSTHNPKTKGNNLVVKVNFETRPLSIELHRRDEDISTSLLTKALELVMRGVEIEERGERMPSIVIRTSNEHVDSTVQLLQDLNQTVANKT